MKDDSIPPRRSARTAAVHGGTRRSQYGEVSEAIFLTQGFVYPTAQAAADRFEAAGPDEFIYARYGNPTVAMFEERLAEIEGAEDCFATASGMAAVNGALCAMLRAGDRVVSSRALFGSCHYILDEVLRRYGVEVAFVDGRDLDAWRAAVTPGTKAVFFESVSNPCLEVIDIAAVSGIAHEAGATVIVDNVFATPVFGDAMGQGADVVIYSATKHIDGQGRALGGAILGSRDFVRGTVEPYLKHTGGAMSPFNAWLMLKGLETLHLRCGAQADAAARLAAALGLRSAGGARALPPPADASRRGDRAAADGEGGDGVQPRPRDARAGLRLPRRADDPGDLQQPRRRQEHRDPSGDDDAPAPDGRDAADARHRRGAGAGLGGPRGPGRPPGGHGAGAGGGGRLG